jgi:hypothetical protein
MAKIIGKNVGTCTMQLCYASLPWVTQMGMDGCVAKGSDAGKNISNVADIWPIKGLFTLVPWMNRV